MVFAYFITPKLFLLTDEERLRSRIFQVSRRIKDRILLSYIVTLLQLRASEHTLVK
jgi:hypothetical protein